MALFTDSKHGDERPTRFDSLETVKWLPILYTICVSERITVRELKGSEVYLG